MTMTLILAAALAGQAPRAAPAAAAGQSVFLAPDFKAGQVVRLNSLYGDNEPFVVALFPTREAAEGYGRRVMAGRKAGLPVSMEGVMFGGHNTRATVLQTRTIPGDGESPAMYLAELRIEAGALAGRRLWGPARLLRPAGDPDPAEEMRAEAASRPRPAPPGAKDLIAKRKAKKTAAYARTLDREAKEAIAAARAARDYEKMYKEMLPYMLEDQRQQLERMSAAERNAALQRMAGAMERAAGYVYPGQSPTQGPYK
jgi:hypothetical protein